MALTVQNGALRLEGNALGTGEACCCGECERCSCPNKCGYVISTSTNELSTTASATFASANCNSCNGTQIEQVANPQDTGNQIGGIAVNYLEANAARGSGFYASGLSKFNETYEYINGNQTIYKFRSSQVNVIVYCTNVGGLAKWRVYASIVYGEVVAEDDTSTTPFTNVRDQSSSFEKDAEIDDAVDNCDNTPNITVSVTSDDVTINGVSYPLNVNSFDQTCIEDLGGASTPCADYLANYPVSETTFQMTWTGDCDGPCDVSPP